MILNRSHVRLRALPALLAGFIALTTAALSQSPFWSPTNGPLGGIVRDIIVDPQGTLYTGTAGSGVFRSTDNGETWNAVNNGLDNHHITTDHLIWALAHRPGGSLVAAAFGTIYYSSDEGNSWSEAAGIPWVTFISSLATAPDGSFIAATMAGLNSGIYRSTDGGANWVKTGLAGIEIQSLIVTRQGSILAGSNESKGIYRSTDNGATWHATSLTDMTVHHMVVDSSGVITTRAVDGFYAQSSDDGVTWQEIDGNDFWRLGTMAVAPNGDIYNSTTNGLFKRSGWDEEWTDLSQEDFARTAECMVFAPNGDLFIGSYIDGVYRYRPSTGEWKEVNRGLTNRGGGLIAHPNGTIYAEGYQGISYVSSDRGKKWTRSIDRIPLAIYPTGEIVTETGKSRDNGATWEDIVLPDHFPVGMMIGPQGKLYMATFDGAYASSDTGTTWDPIFSTTHYVNAMTVDRAGTIVVTVDSMESMGVERSTDGGATWSFHPTSDVIIALAVDSTGALIGGGYSGIYRSTDGGITWSETTAPAISFNSLVVSRGGHIYAGTPKQGVYRSTDDGATWAELNDGLANRFIVSLAVDYDDYVYVGTHGGGVFVSNSSPSSVEWEETVSGSLALQSHPNPFAGATAIRFSLPHAAHTSLVITNMLGQPVAILADEQMEEGPHTISWNPTGLPNGMYFCTLKTGSHTKSIRVIRQ